MKVGRKPEYPEKTPWRASENATYYIPRIQAPSETRTRAVALVYDTVINFISNNNSNNKMLKVKRKRERNAYFWLRDRGFERSNTLLRHTNIVICV